jgi:hypothetical protein
MELPTNKNPRRYYHEKNNTPIGIERQGSTTGRTTTRGPPILLTHRDPETTP